MANAECRFSVEVVGVALEAEDTVKAEVVLIAANLPELLRMAMSQVDPEED